MRGEELPETAWRLLTPSKEVRHAADQQDTKVEIQK